MLVSNEIVGETTIDWFSCQPGLRSALTQLAVFKSAKVRLPSGRHPEQGLWCRVPRQPSPEKSGSSRTGRAGPSRFHRFGPLCLVAARTQDGLSPSPALYSRKARGLFGLTDQPRPPPLAEW